MNTKIDYELTDRRPFAGGETFGAIGSYDILSGIVHFRIDPSHEQNAGIVDLRHAPRDADGLVEMRADFFILKPQEMDSGNRRVLFEFANRGNKRALQFFNDARASNRPVDLADAGNGFLMREGYTIVWLAWQGDIHPGNGRLVLDVPVATLDGEAITAQVFSEFIAGPSGTKVFPLSAMASMRSYPTVSLSRDGCVLTRRRYYDSEREVIPSSRWEFARLEVGLGADGHGAEHGIVPSDGHIYLEQGFDPGAIYELQYQACEPLVLGLGHAAVRDFVSFLRNGEAAATGKPNLLAGDDVKIEKVYAWGRSQAGRCIRDFIHLGFNEDMAGDRVFDGVIPHVAGGGKMWMNHRFACPGLLPGQTHENHAAPVDIFPFSYTMSRDHVSGREDGILKRPATDPLVIHTDTAAEYWHRRGSLVHTDTEGRDLAQPETVRVYLWSSSQHWATAFAGPPSVGGAQTYFNVVATTMLVRASLVLLDSWATQGIAPPPSRVPLRSEGTLVDGNMWRHAFPAIPGIGLPAGPSALEVFDYGSRFAEGHVDMIPPRLTGQPPYAVGVPNVDADGNDVAGVRAPMVQAPLGTYTGWSLRSRGQGHGAQVSITGSYIPFPETEEVRQRTCDPRDAVASRYEGPDAYVAAIRKAAETLADERLILAEDVERAVQMAADWGRPRHLIDL